jgi:hypothetical protein
MPVSFGGTHPLCVHGELQTAMKGGGGGGDAWNVAVGQRNDSGLVFFMRSLPNDWVCARLVFSEAGGWRRKESRGGGGLHPRTRGCQALWEKPQSMFSAISVFWLSFFWW